MNLTLKRTAHDHDGIFGELKRDDGSILCYTLEHAYDSKNGDGSYAPKLPVGTYRCVRGPHRLATMRDSFITFEVLKVPGHTGILFHVGNYNDDSSGCILVGKKVGYDMAKHCVMLEQSRRAFQEFLSLQQNENEFILTVEPMETT